MTCTVIQFPRKQMQKLPELLPEIEAWVDEVDDLGPYPNPVQADHLLKRCPDQSHPTAVWLKAFSHLADKSSLG